MYSDIATLLESYNKKKMYADEDFVNTICEIIRDYRKINKFVNNWNFNPKMKAMGQYNYDNYTMSFNLQYDESLRIKKIYSNYQYIFYNMEVLIGILHEFVHVNQIKRLSEIFESKDLYQEIKENNSLLEASILYLSSDNFKKDNDNLISNLIEKMQFFYYRHHHDNDPIEREADNKSIYETKLIINKLNKNEITELINNYINTTGFYVSLRGYKLKSNITNNQCIDYFRRKPFLKDRDYFLNALPIFNDLSISLDTRLLYGLSLIKDEFVDLNDKYLNADKIFRKSLIK